MHKLREVICVIWDHWLTTFAENLEESNWARLIRQILGAAVLVLGFLGGIVVLLALLYSARSALIPLIGGPAIVALLIASYRTNRADSLKTVEAKIDTAMREEWAESLYPWVRDGLFLVFRALSEYTAIIRPASPSAIETQARFYIRDNLTVFQFTALFADKIDLIEFRRDLERVLGQMLRAGELLGLPSKLVTVNGKNYVPLQVYALTDMGSSVNVDIVFADEHSIPHINARKHLLEPRKTATVQSMPYDHEF